MRDLGCVCQIKYWLLQLIPLDVEYRKAKGEGIEAGFYSAFGNEAVSLAEQYLNNKIGHADLDVDVTKPPILSTVQAVDSVAGYLLEKEVESVGVGRAWVARNENYPDRKFILTIVDGDQVADGLGDSIREQCNKIGISDTESVSAVVASGQASGSSCFFVFQLQDEKLEPPRKSFGKYKVLRLLGIGGFGSVYHAFDESLDREVAIKTLRIERRDSFYDAGPKGR